MFPLLRIALWLSLGIVLSLQLPLCLSAWWLWGCLLAVTSVLLWLTLHGRKEAAACRGGWKLTTSLLTGVGIAVLGMLLCQAERQRMDVDWTDEIRSMSVVVCSEPRTTTRSTTVDVLTLDGMGHKLRLYFGSGTRRRLLVPGQLIDISARIERPRQWVHGRFDYRQYLLAHGYVGTAFVDSRRVAPCDDMELLGRLPTMQRLRLRFAIWRHGLLQRYDGLSSDEAETAVLRAMTLGDKSQLSAQLRQSYGDTGASHVLALSGLHLSIVAWVMLLWVRRRRMAMVAGMATLALVWGFALVSGLPGSVVRAAIMVSTYVVMRMGRRQSNGLNSLGLSAVLILLCSPLSVCDVGFQLSFLAVAAILSIVPRTEPWLRAMQERLEPLPEPLNRMVASTLSLLWHLAAVAVAAQAGTAPLVAYHFGRLPVYFLAVNMLVIPLAYGILTLGLAVVVLPWAAAWLATPLTWLLHTMNAGIGRIAQWPGACVDGLHPSEADVVLCYLLMVIVYRAMSLMVRPPSRFSTRP